MIIFLFSVGEVCTIRDMTLAFEVQRKQFVQVLHINENHWVTASNIGCPVATVDIFDSM